MGKQASGRSLTQLPSFVELGCLVRAESGSGVPDEAAVSRATVGLSAQLLRSLRERHCRRCCR
jgi:hypothetical protein